MKHSPKYRRRTARSSPAPKKPSVGSATLEGVYIGTKNRFGFVTAEGIADIFIPAGKNGGAIDGDVVSVRYRRNRFGGYEAGADRFEGEVTSILTPTRRTLVGTYLTASRFSGYHMRGGSRYIVIPDESKIPYEIPVSPHPDAADGDKVEIKLSGRKSLFGEVTRIFGPAASREANYEAILAGAGVERDFEPEAEREAVLQAARPINMQGRRRVEHEVILTMDSESAKDLDDAVSLRRLAGGKWLLGVHIADVSSYVLPKTPLDRAAMARGTSVYFADEVIPMLPTALSNGACSLGAGEEKAALSAYLTVSPDGELLSCRVEKTAITSRVRGVYSEINAILTNTASDEIMTKYRAVLPTVRRMHELYLRLAERSAKRGAMTLDRPEAELILDEKGIPIEIRRRERGDSEKMIEQFMLLANEGVATLLHERGIPCVYRIHENPPPDKLSSFLQYAQLLGLVTSGIDPTRTTPRELTALMDEAREKGCAEAISYPLLRAMSKASYSDAPRGHFGLGLSLYCHFTSPIRRLSDLATHRIISDVLLGKESSLRYSSYAKRAAAAATDGELRALDAERRIEAMYKALYLSRHIGETFSGQITSVTGFGFFVELENTCEGLVPLGSLCGYFLYDERSSSLVSGEKTYSPGMTLSVLVEDVDAMRGQITFSVVQE